MSRNTLPVRRDLVLGAASTAFALTLPRSMRAQDTGDPCRGFDKILRAAEAQAEGAAAWSITVAPDAIDRLEARIAELRREITGLDAATALARRAQLLAYANAVGGTLIFIVGASVGASSAPLVFVGSVAFSGTMLLAGALLSPEQPSTLEIANISVSRLGGVADIASREQFTVSATSAAKSAVAAKLVTAYETVFNFYQFAQKTATFQGLTVEVQRVEERLAAVQGELAGLRQIQTSTALREACAEALAEDALRLRSGLNCLP